MSLKALDIREVVPVSANGEWLEGRS